jgi:predicted RNase H-like HicB family nuclease
MNAGVPGDGVFPGWRHEASGAGIIKEMPKEFTIIFEVGEDGWWIATIAEVPGAFSQGRTKEEARENVLDALAELMSARREMALRQRGASSEVESVPLSA